MQQLVGQFALAHPLAGQGERLARGNREMFGDIPPAGNQIQPRMRPARTTKPRAPVIPFRVALPQLFEDKVVATGQNGQYTKDQKGRNPAPATEGKTMNMIGEKEDQGRQAGAIRIGNGNKLHPAYKDPRYGLIITCSCPGTQQGSAYHRATFFPGKEANCQNRGQVAPPATEGKTMNMSGMYQRNGILVIKEGEGYWVSFPFDRERAEGIKAIRGAKFNGMTKKWFVPESSSEELQKFLGEKSAEINEKEPARDKRQEFLAEFDRIWATFDGHSRAEANLKKFRAAVEQWTPAEHENELVATPFGLLRVKQEQNYLIAMRANADQYDRDPRREKIIKLALKLGIPPLLPTSRSEPPATTKQQTERDEWTKEVTESRRAAWNEWLKDKSPSAADVAEQEKKQGFTAEALKRNLAWHAAAAPAIATRANLLAAIKRNREEAKGEPITADMDAAIGMVNRIEAEDRPYSETVKGKWTPEEKSAFERLQAWERERKAAAKAEPAKATAIPDLSTAADRIYLTVPFSDKDKVKAKGAKWDGDRKKWYWPTSAGDMPEVVKGYAK